MCPPKIGNTSTSAPINHPSSPGPSDNSGQNPTRSSSMNARGPLQNLMPFAAKGTIGEMQNTAAAAFQMGPGASPALVDAAHSDPKAIALRQKPVSADTTTELCDFERDKAKASDQSVPQNAMAAHPLADFARRGAAQTAGLNTSLHRNGIMKTHVEGGWNVFEDVIGVHGS